MQNAAELAQVILQKYFPMEGNTNRANQKYLYHKDRENGESGVPAVQHQEGGAGDHQEGEAAGVDDEGVRLDRDSTRHWRGCRCSS